MGSVKDAKSLRFEPYWKVFALSMGSNHAELVDPKGKTRRTGDGDALQKIADERNAKLAQHAADEARGGGHDGR